MGEHLRKRVLLREGHSEQRAQRMVDGIATFDKVLACHVLGDPLQSSYFCSKAGLELPMGMPVRIESHLYELARSEAAVEKRTIAGQIEYWAMVGRAALDNPDLPVTFVAESLASMAEPREQAAPFIPRTRKR